jgi:hypothetical protein
MKAELKNELHKLIDEIEDEEALNTLREDAAIYAGKKDILDDLTEEELKELDESIAEADRGEIISYDEFLKHMDEWKRKLS